jgi:probable F420-dependent oxidoreductase
MSVKIGYLLPTREGIMDGRHAARPIIDLARHAEELGYDSVWIGDSVLAKPRHEPLTMLAAIAGCTEKIELGTAVLLPILRNPVHLAHQVATLDQVSEGRVILGIGSGQDIPPVHAEFKAVGVPFEKRLGRMMEGIRLCQALWSGEPVTWDGRWTLKDAVLAPKPHRPGGPPIWGGGSHAAAISRAGAKFDGWFPSGPSDVRVWAQHWAQVKGSAEEAGRGPDDVTAAIYLTLSVDDDVDLANARLNDYLERYYNQPAEKLRRYQGAYAGPADGAIEWLRGFVDAGVSHLALRFAGDAEAHLQFFAARRGDLTP